MPKSKVRKKNDFTVSAVSRTPVKVKVGPSSVWFVCLFIGLMLIGFVQSFAMIGLAVILMRTSSEHMRGRVMGVRMMVIYGLPIGLMAAGVLIERIGFAAAGSLYAIAGIVFTIWVALRWRADLWQVDAPANSR